MVQEPVDGAGALEWRLHNIVESFDPKVDFVWQAGLLSTQSATLKAQTGILA